MAKQFRCLYCNASAETSPLKQETGKIAGLGHGFYFCSESCHHEIVHYAQKVNSESNRFLLLILGSSLSFLPFLLLVFLTPYHTLFSALATAMPLLLVGLVIIRYPFVTPETIKFWGIRKSIAVAKKAGIVMIIAGAIATAAIWMIG
jgi:YHS domain-containing protein